MQVPPAEVRQLTAALRAVSEAAATGTALEKPPELPDDEVLKPVTEPSGRCWASLGSGRAG